MAWDIQTIKKYSYQLAMNVFMKHIVVLSKVKT